MKRLLIILIGALLVFSSFRLLVAVRKPAVQPPPQAKVKPPQPRKQFERLPVVVFEPKTPDTKIPENSIVKSTVSEAPSNPISQPPISPGAPTKPKSSKPPLKDPIARVALAEVGFDSDAEEYWLMAINDPTLSDGEREDLIEDLNEEGFADPDNVTLDDLPLIMSRIQIIEEYAPSAMDDNNLRSFAEAYKDLLNMFAKVTGN